MKLVNGSRLLDDSVLTVVHFEERTVDRLINILLSMELNIRLVPSVSYLSLFMTFTFLHQRQKATARLGVRIVSMNTIVTGDTMSKRERLNILVVSALGVV